MNRLQEKRLEPGLTQPQVLARLEEVEARADVGMIPRYEKGIYLPTKDQLAALEELYGVSRATLYDVEDLDPLEFPRTEAPTEGSKRRATIPPPSHAERFRKCYHISQEFAENLPDDLPQVYGYSSQQGWHDAALEGLLSEYAARNRSMKKKEDKTA